MKKKILIIEDYMTLGELMVEKLKRKDYDVMLAGTGDMIEEKMQKFTPDLIILDIKLASKDEITKGIDGIEVLKKLKLNEQTKKIPVLMVTAVDDKNVMRKALELGAIEYFTKPFDMKQLISKVEEVLKR